MQSITSSIVTIGAVNILKDDPRTSGIKKNDITKDISQSESITIIQKLSGSILYYSKLDLAIINSSYK